MSPILILLSENSASCPTFHHLLPLGPEGGEDLTAVSSDWPSGSFILIFIRQFGQFPERCQVLGDQEVVQLWKALWGRRALTKTSPGLVLSPRSFHGVSSLLNWSRPASSPWLPVRHRAASLDSHHPCALSRARCRGQHGGEDEAAGVCPEQKEGAGASEPEPLPLQRPPLLVRVSAAWASPLCGSGATHFFTLEQGGRWGVRKSQSTAANTV